MRYDLRNVGIRIAPVEIAVVVVINTLSDPAVEKIRLRIMIRYSARYLVRQLLYLRHTGKLSILAGVQPCREHSRVIGSHSRGYKAVLPRAFLNVHALVNEAPEALVMALAGVDVDGYGIGNCGKVDLYRKRLAALRLGVFSCLSDYGEDVSKVFGDELAGNRKLAPLNLHFKIARVPVRGTEISFCINDLSRRRGRNAGYHNCQAKSKKDCPFECLHFLTPTKEFRLIIAQPPRHIKKIQRRRKKSLTNYSYLSIIRFVLSGIV